MKTEGVEAIFLTTHNWGRSAKFFQSLGYTLDFETDHNSGQLRNGGPLPLHRRSARRPGASHAAGDESRRCPGSPAGPRRRSRLPFQDTHWGTQEMTVRDPDGRVWSLQAPSKSGATAMPNSKAPAQTARPSAPRCGAPCICKPMRRRMSSRTTSACGCWPRRTAGASDPTWIRSSPGPSARPWSRGRVRGRPGAGTGRPGRRAVRDPGRGPGQLRPAPARHRQPHACVRSGPARAAGMEAPATGRAGLRRAGMAATGPGGLRGRRFRLASAGRGGLRCDAPGLRRFHGRQHVSDRDATLATFRQVAALAPGSTLAMTFVLPVEQMAPEVRPGIEMAVKGARASGRRSSASMRRPRSWRWRGRRVPRCPARRARRARAAVLRGANGRLELVERRRISDCGHVAGEYCPTADPALIPGHQTARHPTRQAPAR